MVLASGYGACMTTRAERRAAQDLQRQLKAAARMDPAVATDICLVRHGQTSWNAERRLQGHRDPPLNDEGLRQAEELAALLQAEPFHAIYSSDLRRALQTAEALASCRPGGGQAEVRARPGLRERRLGVLEGLTLPEAAQREPAAFAILRAHDEDACLPGGGESTRAMVARVVAELERIAAGHPGQSVLVVAHGGVLHAVHLHAVGRSCDGAVHNASVHRVRVQGARWAVVRWDEHGAAEEGDQRAGAQFGGGAKEG
ncbi:putative phosphatase PhoE [Tetrabaena socialis]|uniref:Putative phosphatase PhoE n=1 Tax=Tetrabaena socialis TaxID=47790 RepID=A0A2J8A5C4_9CHLO|nr:putative phosphatase PhoE [Tetrabaena socialis]|eukprot:PNH07705.1 putative phosphatase PhoE [Tetrabaena socialis]